MSRLVLLIYNILYPFVLVAMLPGFVMRMLRRGNYRHKFGQRFGIYSRRVRDRVEGRTWTWVHAVSVGECIIALKLIDRMKAAEPGLNIALATTTSTGFVLARKSAESRDWMEVIYNPIDFIIPVTRALNLFRPRRIILVEAEVWPNMVAQARRRGVPVFLVNARLSPRSARRYAKARAFTGPIFRLLTAICVQEEEDIERWLGLGARRDQLKLTGSIKFDQDAGGESRAGEFREFLSSLGVPAGAPILLGGSTFPGEEKLLAEVFQRLRPDVPDLFLILVPRHFERTSQVLDDLRPLDLRIARRTALLANAKSQIPNDKCPDVLIVDTTGELRDWYHLATVVFIGKSVTSTGGQNPVEAVMAGKPVIHGPHMENFSAIIDRWRKNDASIEIRDSDELADAVRRLLADPSERIALAERARAAVAVHQGATERTTRIVLEIPA